MIKKLENLISILSILNTNNFSAQWWAFNFTTKNPLNSFFFDKIILKKNLSVYEFNKVYNLFIFFIGVVKSFFLLLQSFIFYLTLKKNKLLNNTFIFSYIDGRSRENGDTYFNNLIDEINNSKLNIDAAYLFYVYRPYFKNNRAIVEEKNDYENIFSYLRPVDFIWCFFQIFKIPFLKIDYTKTENFDLNINIKKVLTSHMISEISSGYLDNLILYRAFKRLSKEKRINRLIYPFENKSFEKLMLLETKRKIKTIGYQHSSITPRHFSLCMTKEERKINPLPDIIVTIGEITKKWLVQKGNIPKEKIRTGVYLRGVNKIKTKKSFSDKKVNLLFTFSSSYSEIIKTVDFLRSGFQNLNSYKITFRFHPDFAFKQLNRDYKKWINRNIDSISKISLIDELKCCDVLVYTSSSISIEAISSKIPVIYLDIDIYNSDPLLNKKLGLRRAVSNINDFVTAIKEFSILCASNNKEYFKDSVEYVDKYAIDKSKLNIKTFL